MPESRAHKEWTKANTSFVGLRLNHNTDADILQALEGKAKQTEIKRLLRIAIQRQSDKQDKKNAYSSQIKPADVSQKIAISRHNILSSEKTRITTKGIKALNQYTICEIVEQKKK